MSNQPEALRLADWLEDQYDPTHNQEQAAKLRRLSAEHEEDQKVIAVWRGRTQRAEAQRDALLEALKTVLAAGRGTSGRIILEAADESAARAAIAAAEREEA